MRFIPAGTGNSHSEWRIDSAVTVYPRRYGEQFLQRQQLLHLSGLSPQVRGTEIQHSQLMIG